MNPFLITIIVIVGVVVLIAIILFIVGKLFGVLFSHRFDADVRYKFLTMQDFKELKKENVSISGYKNNKLNGAIFYYPNKETKGTIIFYHGLFCGYINYLNVIEYFARNGFKIVAFDMVGCYTSSGIKTYGMQIGDIDNKKIIDFVVNNNELNKNPIFTVGHSWGGHLSLTSLLHDDNNIKKAVAFSPYNSNVDSSFSITKLGFVFAPFIYLYNILKFGRYATYSSCDAIKYSSADIFIAHGQKDLIVKPQYSLYKYMKVAGDNVTFKIYKDGEHFLYLSKEAEQSFTKNISFPRTEPIDFKHLDYSLIYQLNYKLLDQIIDFLNK